MHRSFRRLFRLAAREPTVSADVHTEIATHLAELTDWYQRQGLSPAQAAEAARARFGDVDQFRREIGAIDQRAGRIRRWGESAGATWRDLVIAARSLRRAPTYTAVIVITLGIALGANATMFGVVDRLLLRPPPGIAAPGEVRRIEVARWADDGQLTPPWDAVSYPSFIALRDQMGAFRQVAAVTRATLSLGLGAEARPARTVFASGEYFTLLMARPSQGRFFDRADDQPPAGAAVVVLSDRFWRTGFGADSAIVGRTLSLNHRPYQVIGVAAPGFNGTDLESTDLWLPLQSVGPLVQGTTDPAADWRTGRGWQWLNLVARLAPATTPVQAAELATASYRAANRDFRPFEANARVTFRSLTAYSEDAGPERVAGWLYGVTVAVLLIACANIANMVLARGLGRSSEIAVRKALGISRPLLARQFLMETVLVVGLGLVVGLLLTRWGGTAVRAMLLEGTVWNEDPVSLRVLGATAGAAALAALLASWWPLAKSARVDPAAELHGAGRSTSRGGHRVRRALLLVQTTFGTTLVVLAGLFVRSIATIRGLDLGIRPAGAYLVSIDLEGTGLGAQPVRQLFDWAAERIRTIPGVVAAGVTVGAPFRSNMGSAVVVPGRDSIPRPRGGGPYLFRVGPGALDGYGVRLIAGRLLEETDRAGATPVALVSERMARTIWPGQSPLGRCFYPGRQVDSLPCLEIVGVVADLHRQALDEAPFFLYFTPFAQADSGVTPQYLVIRTAPGQPHPAEVIRRTLLAERPDLPFVSVIGYPEILSEQARQWKMGASLLTVFALISLLIAAIGLSGVIVVGISQRRREIGLRAALGAPRRRLLWDTIGGGLLTAAAGICLGVGLAVVASGSVESLLFQTKATDTLVLGGAAGVMSLVAALAALIPGLRSLRIDPMVALRND